MISVHNISFVFALVLFSTGLAQAAGGFQQTSGGALYKDLKTGEGEVAEIGDVATIHFIGWLDDSGKKGREFVNTRQLGETVSFVIGTDKVMPGWNEGVIGMQAGGRRLLKLPPDLGYGSKGVQDRVPANARLILMIELVGLR